MARRVTIVDVAREAGVAISTVSAALNGRDGVAPTTRERVLEAAQRMGWVPSMQGRSLVSRRAWAVGLLLQRPASVLEADPFFAGFLGGVETVLDPAGHALVLMLAATPEKVLERMPRWALGGVVDGVFLTDVQADDPRFAMVEELALPAVAINVTPPGGAASSVTQDHHSGLRDLMAHVLSLGHERVAHLAGPAAFVHSGEREQVWRDALAEAGLPPGPLVRGDFSTESGAKAADALLDLPEPPTAVVCANDLMAIGLVSRAGARRVRVPQELSVTGFDGIRLASYISPPLTTVRTSPHHLGSRAAELLLDRIAGGAVEHAHIEPAGLVLAGSTAPPPPGH
ncbi:LacI family DNA-binding transcriptional regulator [Propioniciclava soli]|uniref:LacI family DNA-binding transcriptional regulator n=1 Tax=Propioniciclava soli TaxID=2775081 RepID=A0ABZ3C5Z3_9ACTN